MTFTPNRNIEQPAHNADINTWDVNVNANWAQIDSAFGGVTNINVTGASGTITLSNSTASPPSYINPTFKVSGTLTNNVNYQFPSGVGGLYTVINTTTGAFTVTFSSAGGGSSTVLPQQTGTIIQSDGANVIIPVNYLAGLGVGLFASFSPFAAKGTGTIIQIDGPASTGSAYINFTNNGANHDVIVGYDIAGGQIISTSAASSLCFRNDVGPILWATNGPAGKMALNSNGALLINTLTQAGAELLRVFGAAYVDGTITAGNVIIANTLQINGAGNSVTAGGFTATNGTMEVTGFGYQTNLDFTGSVGTTAPNGMQMTCVSGGVLLSSGATAWAAVSDEREKTDLVPITDALPKISTLRTVTGRYKYEAPGTSHPFLIAQDVQKVLPEAVSEKGDGTLMVRYTDTLPLVVAALKEANHLLYLARAEIEELKARLDKAGL